MIDRKRLQDAYDNDEFYSLQLEVGDLCKQGCIYCYMNALPETRNTLSDADIKQILQDASDMNIHAIEWLGGEPLLRQGIFSYLDDAKRMGFRNNMWTGGLPLHDKHVARKCAEACEFGLISVHVSSITREVYQRLHPNNDPGDLNKILDGVKNLLDLGYPNEQLLNSVTFTGLQDVDDIIKTMDFFEEEFGILTSLNIYHTYLRPEIEPGKLTEFIPSKKAVAKVYRHYARQYHRKYLPMNCVNKQYCSSTIAILADGSVTPCATIREKDAPNIHSTGNLKKIAREHLDHLIFKRLKDPKNLPDNCKSCFMNDECWGCRSRAHAASLGLTGPDPRCFRTREEKTK
ncbi:MAG: radical SAM/SPASM domain-containing protein [Promethearchaeota archaeon]